MRKSNNSWKNIVYLTGAGLGLVMGLTAAHLYAQAAEESGQDGAKPTIETGEALRIGLAAVTLVRQISSLGASTKK